MYTIYCHIFPNEKRYVGLTSTSLAKRWQDGNGYKTCPLVDRAIQKYGWKNVTHEILAECESKEEAEALERKFIFEFDTLNPDRGYNILPGGDVSDNHATDEMRHKLGNGNRGRHHTLEEKKHISQGVKRAFDRPESNGHIGRKASDDTKRKMSQAHKERWKNEEMRAEASERMRKRMENPKFRQAVIDRLLKNRPNMKGRCLSEETKRKISEAGKGKRMGKNSPSAKPVNQYTVSGEFVRRWDCAMDAERAGFGVSGNINKCCAHAPHCLTAKGYKWEWADK